MTIFKPFKAYRPTPELAKKIAALPYDVMSSNEARKMASNNPYSFLHVDKAEIDLAPEIDIHSTIVYEKARDNLRNMMANNYLVQDSEPYFYIYRQVMDGRSQTGLVGCASIDEYLNNTIKKHENTRADKELDRINHVDFTDAHTGPIFLTYRKRTDISSIINDWIKSNNPVYDFVSEDGISHTVWIINDFPTIERLSFLLSKVDCLYIADGHHRSASAVKVGLKRRQQYPEYDGTEEFNYFLSVLFPDEDLHIMDYNRVIKDLNGLTESEFLNKVQEKFELIPTETKYKPEKKHTFGMFLDKRWYKLVAKDGIFDSNDPVDRLDVTILQENILGPILGIMDPRTDSRIDFIGGIRGLNELEQRVLNGMKVAFSMYPTTIDDLMSIADAGKIMPPKSTWFEPKLRSGLFIHDIKQGAF